MSTFIMLSFHNNSRLDQGLSERYSCPTCRKPLFGVRPEENTISSEDISGDEQLARQISSRLERRNTFDALAVRAFSNQPQHPSESIAQRFSSLLLSSFCSLSVFCYSGNNHWYLTLAFQGGGVGFKLGSSLAKGGP